jgi:hypothetical protein
MTQCLFLVFYYFCVSEKLHRKYSRNSTKQKPKSLITWQEYEVQKRGGDRPEADRTYWWRGPPWPRHQWCDRLVHLLTSPFCLYILLDEKTLGARTLFQKTYCKPSPWSGGSRSSSRHPTREGNHHRRPSSSPCLPPEWCASSLPWTTGP